MNILCLDLEGVLIPEIWLAVADETNLKSLRVTTRDIEDYDELMRYRLDILRSENITYSYLQSVISTIDPLPGASEFLSWARKSFQVAILSDTYYEMGLPLTKKLGEPFLLCHKLVIRNDRVVDYVLRQKDPKSKAVLAFQSLSLKVIAAGDSYNDLGMLRAADKGFFFRAPDNIVNQYDFDAVKDYVSLQAKLLDVQHNWNGV